MESFKTRTKTVWVLGVISLVMLGWELHVYLTPETGDTISEVILSFARRHPILPFGAGVLSGHFFWPQEVPVEADQCNSIRVKV